MLKKSVYLIFLAFAFLFFNCAIKAMQGQSKRPKCDKVEEFNSREVNSLTFLAASKYVKELIRKGLSIFNILNILDNNDENDGPPLPQDLIYYCKRYILDEHCILLQKIENNWIEHESGKKENNFCAIEEYKDLIKTILNEHPDFNLILSIFDNHFRLILKYCNLRTSYQGISLNEITLLLKLLININKGGNGSEIIMGDQVKNKGLSIYRSMLNNLLNNNITNEFDNEFRENYIYLFRFLLAKKLLPSLDYPMYNGQNFLHVLVSNLNDIQLFREIINKPRVNSIAQLFNSCELSSGITLLHDLIYTGSKDKITIILDLMKKKNLNLNDFIHIPNKEGITPFMLALKKGDYEIIELFTNYANLRKIDNKSLVNQLKSLAALEVNKNKDKLNLSLLPVELQKYCQNYTVVPLIEARYASLEQCYKGNCHYPNLKVTQENLNEYKQLLYEIMDNNLDLREIFFGF